METITIILSIVLLMFSILQIILFFKLWEMTNDVKDIKTALLKGNETPQEQEKRFKKR